MGFASADIGSNPFSAVGYGRRVFDGLPSIVIHGGAPRGAAAAKASDLVIVTDDKPRGEDPADIRRQVLEGAPQAREIGGRREAIHAAIAEAGAQDIVLIAGKGHETGQIIGSGENMRVLPFDDVEVARECVGEIARGDA